MPKKSLSDSDLGYGCLFSIVLGVAALLVFVNVVHLQMSIGLVICSLLTGGFVVNLYFFAVRQGAFDSGTATSDVDETDFPDTDNASVYQKKILTHDDFNVCNKICSDFVDYMLKLQTDKNVMSDLKNINGLESVDRHRFGVFNPRLFLMVVHDMLKCYNTLGIYSGSDTVCCTLMYLRTVDDPYDQMDYSSVMIKYDELCKFGNSVIDAVHSLGVTGYDGDTDFMLAGVFTHYGYDCREYLNLLSELASYIIQRHGLTAYPSLADYPERIMEAVPQSGSAVPEKKLTLDDLIGIEGVKREVRKFADFIRVQQMREKEGLTVSPINYHCVFTGNPGTGKTTVARILADIFKDLGILKKGHLVETDRSGLVAEYVGQTAVKTNKLVDEALDGVLFIDEAYSLADPSGKDLYGKEAISILLKRMEDDRDRLIVILAGYDDEMGIFINSNPGLRSRFNRYIHFDDYSAEELWQIFMLNLKKQDYVIDDDAAKAVRSILCEVEVRHEENLGNARFVRNFFEKILENQASRLASEGLADKTALQRITIADIDRHGINFNHNSHSISEN